MQSDDMPSIIEDCDEIAALSARMLAFRDKYPNLKNCNKCWKRLNSNVIFIFDRTTKHEQIVCSIRCAGLPTLQDIFDLNYTREA